MNPKLILALLPLAGAIHTITETVTPTVTDFVTVTVDESSAPPPPPPPATTNTPPSDPTTLKQVVTSSTPSPPAAPPASSAPASSAPAAQPSSSSGGKGQTYNGRATFYSVGLGACGQTNSDSEYVVALAEDMYDASRTSASGPSSYCGSTIEIHYKGKSHQAKIVDMCPGCPGASLDMSPTLFDYFEDPDAGVFQMSWNFV